MFGKIVPWYDFLNTFLSFGQDRRWRSHLAAAVPQGPTRVLDLAAGTLDVSLAVQKRNPHAEVLAMDFCLPMLLRGRGKINPSSPISLSVADALALPLSAECANCITMAFGIRNIRPREAAFAEMFRVLKPGGRACILEFASGKNVIMGGLYNFYLRYLLPLIGRIFSGRGGAYQYLAESIFSFPDALALEDEMRRAGFSSVRHFTLTFGIVCVHIAEK